MGPGGSESVGKPGPIEKMKLLHNQRDPLGNRNDLQTQKGCCIIALRWLVESGKRL